MTPADPTPLTKYRFIETKKSPILEKPFKKRDAHAKNNTKRLKNQTSPLSERRGRPRFAKSIQKIIFSEYG